MLSEFKKFALRGNMIDLAVGVIIGGAFNTIVTSLVNDIIMPLLSLLTGSDTLDFTKYFFALNGEKYKDLATAQAAGAATLNYGAFITGVINFLIMAFVVFILVRQINKLRDKNAPAVEPTTKKCPQCLSDINKNATKCAFCTSEVE